MTDKPRVRVSANDAQGVTARPTTDSFQNFAARVGIGTQNLMSAASYGFNPISRNRVMLEWMYRGSWIVRKAVDAIAEDMTRAGLKIDAAALEPDQLEKLNAGVNDLGIWSSLSDLIKWGRLYGGAIGVILIDGQRNSTPLRLDTVGEGQFKGIAVLDRWMVNPSLNDLIRTNGVDLGKPRYYDITVDGGPMPRQRIHHSRVIRFDGISLPYWQSIAENGWGASIIEPLYDRLVAFDSTTQGAAQLVFKAHLRTMKVPQLREIVAAGGKTLEGLTAQVDMMRLYQANEGLTLLDASDTFETHQYTFSGLDSVLLQFGQQLSGAMDIPLVRLFGQSPAGLNSTGESDLRTYYDGISRDQNSRLRRPITKVLDVMHRSILGAAAPDGFAFKFAPLWELSDVEKSEISKNDTEAVVSAFEANVVDKKTALSELRASSATGSLWGSITDEDLEEAENEPPLGGELLGGDDITSGLGVGDSAGPGFGSGVTFAVHGLGIVVETPKGSIRRGGQGPEEWMVMMPAHYGFIRGTWSAEGDDEEMDCFVGPDLSSTRVWVIDQNDIRTGAFDEHKVMLGYPSEADALSDYLRAYHDGRAFDRIAGVTEMSIDDLKAWLKSGHLDRALAVAA